MAMKGRTNVTCNKLKLKLADVARNYKRKVRNTVQNPNA